MPYIRRYILVASDLTLILPELNIENFVVRYNIINKYMNLKQSTKGCKMYYFIELIIFTILNLLMCVAVEPGCKRAIIAWRLGAVCSTLGCLLFLLLHRSLPDGLFSFILLIICYFNMPLMSPCSRCPSCGKRLYWKPLISSRCSNCHKSLYTGDKNKGIHKDESKQCQ